MPKFCDSCQINLAQRAWANIKKFKGDTEFELDTIDFRGQTGNDYLVVFTVSTAIQLDEEKGDGKSNCIQCGSVLPTLQETNQS